MFLCTMKTELRTVYRHEWPDASRMCSWLKFGIQGHPPGYCGLQYSELITQAVVAGQCSAKHSRLSWETSA